VVGAAELDVDEDDPEPDSDCEPEVDGLDLSLEPGLDLPLDPGSDLPFELDSLDRAWVDSDWAELLARLSVR
jgi:hypothetical protein